MTLKVILCYFYTPNMFYVANNYNVNVYYFLILCLIVSIRWFKNAYSTFVGRAVSKMIIVLFYTAEYLYLLLYFFFFLS